MEKIIIIQSSLSKDSKTAIVANKCAEILKKREINFEIIDLRDLEISFCDGRNMENYSLEMQKIYKKLESANGYICAYPIYNYCFSGVFKNFIDIFSKAMSNKYIGVINNSAGVRSWNHGADTLMKVLGMHNNITMVQPIVHSFMGDFDKTGENLINNIVSEKINDMLDNLLKIIRNMN